MKKFAICLALFATLLFVVSCGGGSKNDDKTDSGDSGETVTDGDTADTEAAGDSEPSDTTADDGDATDSAPDGGDSTDSTPDEEVVTTPCDPNPCLNIAGSNGSCTEKDGAYECECLKNYTWKDNDCVGDSKKTPCANLPENAVWNSASEITQTWDGSMWEPSRFGIYDEEASTTECRFKCKDKYKWDGAKCAIFIPECSAENADKTCKDYETGYIWSVQSPEKYGQENIVTYCEELTNEDLSWRTPNIDELRTIVRNCDKTKFGGACPVSVEYFDYNTYCKPNLGDCNGCDPEEGIEYSIFGTKKGAGNDFSLWSSTQAQENSIMYYFMTFSSDIHMATVGATHTGTRNIRCLGSGKCPEHYELDGNFECVPATREIMCSDLPENAVGNPLLNDTITQTWDVDGEKWIPENTKYEYCENKNPYKCCFQCYSNYEWDSSAKKCLQKTRKVKCEGLPANAEWNGSGEITQTLWGDGTWLPSNTGVYDTNSSTNSCHFKCKSGFWWTGEKCESKTRTVKCEGLPANAEWNTAEEIKQERNESGWWSPSNEGVYNETASTKECRFKCKKDYAWNGSGCGETKKTVKCTNLPSNAEWNTVSEITQTKDSTTGEWLPSNEGVYNETANDRKCVFKCKSGYAWDNVNSKCRKIDCGSYIENAGVCKDTVSGLIWIPYFPDTKYTYLESVDFCANLTVGGYSNWRVPTLDELRTTIRSCSKTAAGGSCPITAGCTTRDCFGDDVYDCFYDGEVGNGPCECPEDKTGIYSKFNLDGVYNNSIWSSTLYFFYSDSNSAAYWTVDYYNAMIIWDKDTAGKLVRCVR